MQISFRLKRFFGTKDYLSQARKDEKMPIEMGLEIFQGHND